MLITVIFAILFFSLIIFIHELGHYLTARMFKVKIHEFAIGMGPKLISKEKGGILYSLRLVPIGGFCAFHGEDAEGAMVDENGNQVKDENGNIVKDPDAFNNQKAWKRLIVLFSGAFMNFLRYILPHTVSCFRTSLTFIVPQRIRTFFKRATLSSTSTESKSTLCFKRTWTTRSRICPTIPTFGF